MSDASFILEAIGVAATAVAAIAAAVGTWLARRSTNAALDAVREARAARRSEILPRLIIEKDFLDFSFWWPYSDGEVAFLARKHWQDATPTKPTFSLSNFGQSPALDITIVFEFDDPNGEIQVPEQFTELGLSIMHVPGPLDNVGAPSLNFRKSDGSGRGWPMYRRWTTDVPHCAPGQTRLIDMPEQLMARIFARGLQYWQLRSGADGLKDIIIVLKLTGYSVEGDQVSTQFRYRIYPFCYGPGHPLEVHGHILELPMYAKPEEPRVA